MGGGVGVGVGGAGFGVGVGVDPGVGVSVGVGAGAGATVTVKVSRSTSRVPPVVWYRTAVTVPVPALHVSRSTPQLYDVLPDGTLSSLNVTPHVLPSAATGSFSSRPESGSMPMLPFEAPTESWYCLAAVRFEASTVKA